MSRIDDLLIRPSRLGKRWLAAFGFALLLFIGVLDYLTGPELAFSLFYIAPIALVVWFGGIGLGVVVAILAAITLVFSDMAAGLVYSNPLIPYWNIAVRASFFLTLTVLLWQFKKVLEREQKVVAQEQRRMFVALMQQLYAPVRGILENASLLATENLPSSAKLCVKEIRQLAGEIQSVLLQLRNLEAESETGGPEAKHSSGSK